MQYKKINNLLGWLCFGIASITYILTLEPSVSFWDCGEFISCAYRLQVAHQPGYPLFAMLGKAFSLLSFGNNAKVPYFTNMMSAIASGATVMFLFWTITALAKKMLAKATDQMVEQGTLLLIMGAGLVGALAFTFRTLFGSRRLKPLCLLFRRFVQHWFSGLFLSGMPTPTNPAPTAGWYL